jgi:hypothetical protein
MKKQKMLSLAGLLILAGISQGSAALYDIKFTGADIWTYSTDNALQDRTDQTAPRRYRDWTQTAGSEVRDTTYGVNNDGAAVDFNTWAPSSGFAFDEINLWGADHNGAGAWGERYISVGNSDPGAEGVSSWTVVQSPTGWTSGIVKGNDPPWSADATHAFPVWRSGTGAALSMVNMNNPSFKFEFIVDIANPLSAFEPDGKLRVYFGGFSDDLQGTGPDNFEVSGVMTLTATAVPEPTTMTMTMIAGALLLLPFGASRLRMLRKNRTA